MYNQSKYPVTEDDRLERADTMSRRDDYGCMSKLWIASDGGICTPLEYNPDGTHGSRECISWQKCQTIK